MHLALADLDYREANHKAGYVYIISNIGAFGENIFKIGMTRRLEPHPDKGNLATWLYPTTVVKVVKTNI